MKPAQRPVLKQAINRQAHVLAVQSFNTHRRELEQRARALMAAGKTVEEIIAAIQFSDLRQRLGQDLI